MKYHRPLYIPRKSYFYNKNKMNLIFVFRMKSVIYDNPIEVFIGKESEW